MRQQRDDELWCRWQFILGDINAVQRHTPSASAMHRSKLDIGGADAGAGGMSISSGSGSAGASGVGASSSSSDASVMAPFHRAGSGVMCLAKSSSRAWRAAASVTASRNSTSLRARKRCHPVVHAWSLSQRSVTTRGAHLAEGCRRHALFMTTSSNEPSKDGAGQRCARLRLDAALEAAEDGHVAGLQVRRASWREEAQYDVWESGLHGGQGGLAGVDAGQVPEKDPRLSFLSRVSHVVQCGRELQESWSSWPSRSLT